MKNLISVKQILTQIKDKVILSFNRTIETASVLGDFMAIYDNEQAIDLIQGVDDADISTINDIIDFIDEKGSVCFNYGEIVLRLNVDHIDDEKELYIGQLLQGAVSNRTMLAYTDGGDIHIEIPHVVVPGGDFMLDDVIASLVEASSINQIILDGISVAQDHGVDVAVDANESAEMQNQFIALAHSHIQNIVGDVASAYDLVLNGLRSGILGLIQAIKTLFESLAKAADEQSGDTFSFIDNSAYSIQKFGIGTIFGTIGSILSFVGPILVYSTAVVGLIVTGFGIVMNMVQNVITNLSDKTLYATVDNADADYLEFPYGVIKGSIPQATETAKYNSIIASCPTLESMGSCRIQLPGCGLYLYLDTVNSIINYQLRLSALSGTNAIDVLYNEGIISDYQISSSQSSSDFITITFQDMTIAERLNILMSKWYDGIDDIVNGEGYALTDSILQQRMRNSLSWFIMLLFFKYIDHIGQNSYTQYMDISINSHLTHWLLILFNTKQLGYTTTFNLNRGWKAYYDKGVDEGINREVIPYFYDSYSDTATNELAFSNYIAGISNSIQTISGMPWFPYENAALYESFTSLGKDFISLPKYDRSQFIRALALTTIATAVITATALVVSFKVSKAIRKKRASLKAKAEHSWDQFKASNNPDDYAAYDKAVRKNNRFVRVFGGSMLSREDYWSPADSNEQNNSYQIYDVIKLIRGR